MMKKRNWILAAALLMGLLLIITAGLTLWSGGKNTYKSAKELAGEAREAASREAEAAQKDGMGAEVVQNDGSEEEESQETLLVSEEQPVILTFAGDVLLSDHVLAAYGRGGISNVVDPGFQQVIDESDLFVVNQEFPFSNRGQAAADKQYTFRLPPERISIFHEMGIDLVTLANNHALDFGREALTDTCDLLDQEGISRIGAGRNLEEAKKPVILEKKGKRIGFLGASRVIPVGSWNAGADTPGMLTTYDPTLLVEEIRALRDQCDYLVVYVHWGIERKERPESYQRQLGQQYIDAGADLVVGSHPHVLQGVEYYRGKPIIYSLGNFVFGSSIPRTALLTVRWDGETADLRFTPGTSSGGSTRAFTEPEKRQEFGQYMTGISYGVTIDSEGAVFAGESVGQTPDGESSAP